MTAAKLATVACYGKYACKDAKWTVVSPIVHIVCSGNNACKDVVLTVPAGMRKKTVALVTCSSDIACTNMRIPAGLRCVCAKGQCPSSWKCESGALTRSLVPTEAPTVFPTESCNLSTGYWSNASRYEERKCRRLSQCNASQYEALPATIFSDRVCSLQPCESSPCLRGGTCVNAVGLGVRTFDCICPAGWSGAVCNVDAYCSNSTLCPVNTTCIHTTDGDTYTCSCDNGHASCGLGAMTMVAAIGAVAVATAAVVSVAMSTSVTAGIAAVQTGVGAGAGATTGAGAGTQVGGHGGGDSSVVDVVDFMQFFALSSQLASAATVPGLQVFGEQFMPFALVSERPILIVQDLILTSDGHRRNLASGTRDFLYARYRIGAAGLFASSWILLAAGLALVWLCAAMAAMALCIRRKTSGGSSTFRLPLTSSMKVLHGHEISSFGTKMTIRVLSVAYSGIAITATWVLSSVIEEQSANDSATTSLHAILAIGSLSLVNIGAILGTAWLIHKHRYKLASDQRFKSSFGVRRCNVLAPWVACSF